MGSGGMGVVWAGQDQTHKRPAAIKLLRSVGEPADRKQLLERARAAKALRHPNILPVHEVGSDGNRDFIAMQLVEGECVADWLAREPALREVVEAMGQAGRALEAAHKAGIVHRNFKLHNVLRDKDGTVRVSDFGLARGQLIGKHERQVAAQAVAGGNPLDGDAPLPRNQHALLDASLTQNGVYVGTPGYMALELWRGMPPDERSDQFAFCVATWEALAGKRPFSGESLEELERSIAAGVNPGEGASLPATLRAVLVRGLDPEPTRRWPNMGALLAALDKGAVPSRSRVAIMAGAGMVAVGSLAAIFFVVRGGGGAPVALPLDEAASPGPAAVASAKACGSATEAFGDVWTAERHAKLEAQRGADQEVSSALSTLDEVRARWSEAYAQACGLSDAAASERARACLMLARDRAGLVVAQLESAGDISSVPELLPAITACR